jgi:transposase
MKDLNTSTVKMTIGIDLGDRYSRLCVIDESGEIIEEGRVPTTEKALRSRFQNTERVRIVMEVGTHSPWVSRLLADLGHEVIVANPRKLRLIYENDSKSDQVDAEYLARIGRLDPKLLAPIQHRQLDTQADLTLIRSRDILVRTRARLVNHVRGSVKSVGGRIPKCSTETFAEKASSSIPQEIETPLSPILGLIANISEQIERYDDRITELADEKYPENELLQQISGVGPVTALTFMLTIEDPYRFKKSREVGSYLGLRPRQGDSGDIQPQLRITKSGDRMTRWLLVQSAQYILGRFGPDCDLRRWGLALAERGGKNAKKRAVVAVARKLAVLLHHLWITGEVYEPLFNAQRELEKAA